MVDSLRDARREAYESARPDVQAVVPMSARRILDLGCATGELGAALRARQGAEVVGVELSSEYAVEARARLDRVELGDVAAVLADPPVDLGRFDCVIAADVLEHLVDPWTALCDAVALLEPGGTAVVSLPNVQYLLVFWRLLRRGSWPREAAGLFDATHLRWFTLRDARALLEGAGLEVLAVSPQYWFPPGWQLRSILALAHTRLAPFLPGQYVLVGRRTA
jgi:2-polyprenyl-3-methyl-5-hydroxy-6-metoxy-1,4-benzoquinol methylase